jgi:hypothetical protein
MTEPRPSEADDRPNANGDGPPLDLEPVGRDGRFIYRLVAGSIVATLAVVFIGGWARGAAAHCGSGLIRPGSTVIPAR